MNRIGEYGKLLSNQTNGPHLQWINSVIFHPENKKVLSTLLLKLLNVMLNTSFTFRIKQTSKDVSSIGKEDKNMKHFLTEYC